MINKICFLFLILPIALYAETPYALADSPPRVETLEISGQQVAVRVEFNAKKIFLSPVVPSLIKPVSEQPKIELTLGLPPYALKIQDVFTVNGHLFALGFSRHPEDQTVYEIRLMIGDIAKVETQIRKIGEAPLYAAGWAAISFATMLFGSPQHPVLTTLVTAAGIANAVTGMIKVPDRAREMLYQRTALREYKTIPLEGWSGKARVLEIFRNEENQITDIALEYQHDDRLTEVRLSAYEDLVACQNYLLP